MLLLQVTFCTQNVTEQTLTFVYGIVVTRFRVLLKLSLFLLCIHCALYLFSMLLYLTIAHVNMPHAGNKCAADKEAAASDHHHNRSIERVIGLSTKL